MQRMLSFLIGIILGGLVGATLSLLFAPMSGDELRFQMQERAQMVLLVVPSIDLVSLISMLIPEMLIPVFALIFSHCSAIDFCISASARANDFTHFGYVVASVDVIP